MEKKALIVEGLGLLGLAGALGALRRMNRSSKMLRDARNLMQTEAGGNIPTGEQWNGVSKEFMKFLMKKRHNVEFNKDLIRSYLNYTDELIGDIPGNIGYRLRWGPETLRHLRSQGRWTLPEELKGKFPIDSKSPLWDPYNAPGRLLHFRELGGSGQVRAFRHWLIEGKTRNFKGPEFKGLRDNHKKHIQQVDDEIDKLRKEGLGDKEIVEALLAKTDDDAWSWLKGDLFRMNASKGGVFDPGSGNFLAKSVKWQDKFGGPGMDKLTNPYVVGGMTLGGAGVTGAGAAKMYQDATKPWHERWRDNLNDRIS